MSVLNKRILIVEDEDALLFGFKKLLGSSTISIHTAPTWKKASSLLQKHDYQVIITDLRLSPSSASEGLDVIKMARNLNAAATIIVITAYAENGTKSLAEKLGANIFLEKPVSPIKLRDILNSL
jgi:CheY-like chemotaxis protein